MTSENTPEEVAQENSKPGKFSFIDRLVGRSYPTKDVEIYLDEKAGHRIQELLVERDQVGAGDVKSLERIDADLAAWRKKAADSRYIIHMEGISVEEYDKVGDAAREQFPIEYNESRHPLTMELERTAVENDDRDTYFRTQLWSKFIRSVEDPMGAIDSDITPQFVAVMSGALPLVAMVRIQLALEELRMTTDWMDAIQDEDFLAKS